MTAERPDATRRIPATDDFPTGPRVGTLLPDFTLPDQHGDAITFSRARGNARAVVLFYRSIHW